MRDRAKRTDRAMLAFSLLAAAYFAAGYYASLAPDNQVLRLEWIWLGAVWELSTLPLIAAVAGAFVFAVVRLPRNMRPINLGSALILFAVNCLVWGL